MARVLVVGGNPASLGLCIFALEFEGHTPIGFLDANVALEAARQEPFDIAVLDLSSPEFDGWGLFHKLDDDPITCGMPILVLADDTYTLLYRLTQVERSDVRGLAKPYDIAEFIAEVQQLAPSV